MSETATPSTSRRIDPVTASVIHGALEHIAVIKIGCASLCPPAGSARADRLRHALVANGRPND